MSDDIALQLDKASYVRSKISFYPMSHILLPIPDGLSVVVFEKQEDIDEYFELRGITDPENFDILPVSSFYDFMREVAALGFVGVWFFNNCPVLFGNYVSDIDFDIPTFAYTYDEQFIGASGKINTPLHYVPWKNYMRTDKMIRRFIKPINGLPFDPASPLFSICSKDAKQDNEGSVKDAEQRRRICTFQDASPLHGPYVSDLGAVALFTDKDLALQYIQSNDRVDKSIYEIEQVDGFISFLGTISPVTLSIDIGLNPGSERFMQGYITQDQGRYLLRTVFGLHEIRSDSDLIPIDDPETISLPKFDSVGRPNTVAPEFRGMRTTIGYPLKRILGSTKKALPLREAEGLVETILRDSKHANGPEVNVVPFDINSVSTNSYLVFGFDKVTGMPFGNNDELLTPYVFSDILDAIAYFYHIHLSFEHEHRLNGFYVCQSNSHYQGSENEELEHYILSERKLALRDLIQMNLVDGYHIEHSEFLKSFVNRMSLSLEIEECGYLGDMALLSESYIADYVECNEESDLAERIAERARLYRAQDAGRIVLDEVLQNRIRIYLGHAYENLSPQSLLILESALQQFENKERRMNHDYAGITMKLCKVFERELVAILLRRWKDSVSRILTKQDMKSALKDAEARRDETTCRLTGWFLKRNKLELGSMAFVVGRLIENCDNDVLLDLKRHVQSLRNSEFILSEEFLDICKLISTRYRNGGVHEKIVTYDICREAFQKILISQDSYLKSLVSV